MISNGEQHEWSDTLTTQVNIHWRWHYLTIKSLSTLLRGITSKYYSDFYCLICLHLFRTKN